MKKSLLSVIAIALSSVALSGCAADAVIGDWKSEDRVNGEKSEMTIEEDGRGTATIYFHVDGEYYYADFDVEWQQDGDDFELDMECDGDCGSLDFTMDCKVNNDETELECDGSDAWKNYEFEWKRD